MGPGSVPQTVMRKEANAVLTGNVGPNAYRTLQAGGVEVITGVTGSVREVAEQWKRGELKPVEGPSVGEKFGM